jgi:hypothetical protein
MARAKRGGAGHKCRLRNDSGTDAMSNPPRVSAPRQAEALLRHGASHCLPSLPASLGLAVRSIFSCTDDARIFDHAGSQPALI